MYYLESPKTDPEWNLALEQYVFDVLGPRDDCFMLWRNDNAVIVGKHQNTLEEIDAGYVRAHGVKVVRRLSGGGAVYHDLGNLNFTFVARHEGAGFDFSTFCRPVVDALRSMGVPAQINGRNDMTIDGKKFSGNAQYVKHGRVMHHGTLMFDSDLEAVGRVLTVKPDKIASKGLKSVRSRVTNIKPYAADGVTMGGFWGILRDYMFQAFDLKPFHLAPDDLAQVERLRQEVYSRWEWNYGASPACSIRKERRVEGCGAIQVHMELDAGRIRALSFYGDYFAAEDSASLVRGLLGVPLEEGALRAALDARTVERCFSRMDLDTFLSILLQ